MRKKIRRDDWYYTSNARAKKKIWVVVDLNGEIIKIDGIIMKPVNKWEALEIKEKAINKSNKVYCVNFLV